MQASVALLCSVFFETIDATTDDIGMTPIDFGMASETPHQPSQDSKAVQTLSEYQLSDPRGRRMLVMAAKSGEDKAPEKEAVYVHPTKYQTQM